MLEDAIKQLRTDAKERGLLDLAVVYGWSALRISEERIQDQMQRLESERAERNSRG